MVISPSIYKLAEQNSMATLLKNKKLFKLFIKHVWFWHFKRGNFDWESLWVINWIFFRFWTENKQLARTGPILTVYVTSGGFDTRLKEECYHFQTEKSHVLHFAFWLGETLLVWLKKNQTHFQIRFGVAWEARTQEENVSYRTLCILSGSPCALWMYFTQHCAAPTLVVFYKNNCNAYSY